MAQNRAGWHAMNGWFLFSFSLLLPWTTFPSFAFGCATWDMGHGLVHRDRFRIGGGGCLGGEGRWDLQGTGELQGIGELLAGAFWGTGGNDAVTSETGSVMVSTADGQMGSEARYLAVLMPEPRTLQMHLHPWRLVLAQLVCTFCCARTPNSLGCVGRCWPDARPPHVYTFLLQPVRSIR